MSRLPGEILKKSMLFANLGIENLCQDISKTIIARIFKLGRLIEDLVGFVALRPKSTAMVIAGRSVHLTTLFPGQA